jgi:hypothetical protein
MIQEEASRAHVQKMRSTGLSWHGGRRTAHARHTWAGSHSTHAGAACRGHAHFAHAAHPHCFSRGCHCVAASRSHTAHLALTSLHAHAAHLTPVITHHAHALSSAHWHGWASIRSICGAGLPRGGLQLCYLGTQLHYLISQLLISLAASISGRRLPH